MSGIRLMQIMEDLHVGGLERVVITICRTIDRDRFEPSVLCLRGGGPLAEELQDMGVTVVDVGGQPATADYFAFRKVARELKQRRVDVIHTHNSIALFDGFAAARLSCVRGHVHTDHARDFPDRRRHMVAEHIISHFVSSFVAVSDHTRDNLVRYEKIAPSRIDVIPNGIDGTRFRRPVDVAAKRAELGVGAGPVIGLAARLTEQKGVIYLLQAVVHLREQFPELRVLIAGSGDQEECLRQKALELDVDDTVQFLGVRLDIPELLQALDVFVIPSVWEGLPMALLEAFAAGCPVVAADVGGIASVIRHGHNGSLVPARDPAALAAELAAVLASADLRRRYTSEGYRTFAEGYSAEAMTRQYEAAYLKAVK